MRVTEGIDTRAPGPSRWELRVGAPVYAADEVLGTLKQVVIDLCEQRVTGLIVRADTLPPRDLLISLDAVEQADDEEIQLLWSSREARERGTFDERSFHIPARALLDYSRGEAVVSLHGRERGIARERGTCPRGMPPVQIGFRVEALDGPAGQVREVLVDSVTGRITHLVVQHGRLWKKDRLLPSGWMRSVTADVVTVDANLADLERLPEYHTDESLQAEILNRWWDDKELQPALVYSYLQATVRDGAATLEGHVWSRRQKERLGELALQVPGLLDIRNEVTADDELPQRVKDALALHLVDRTARVRVESYLGNVRIEGEVPDPETRDLVAVVASRVPGVRSVINQVQLAAEGVSLTGVAPGLAVRCPFGPVGIVDDILVDPVTRQPAYLVVGGGGGLPKDTLVPAGWIRSVDHKGILLHATYDQLLELPEAERRSRPGSEEIPNHDDGRNVPAA